LSNLRFTLTAFPGASRWRCARAATLALTCAIVGGFAGCAATAPSASSSSVAAIAPNTPAVSPAPVASPAPARIVPYADRLQGVELPDPYYWLEDSESAETRAFVEEQRRYAERVLAAAPGQAALARAIELEVKGLPTLGQVFPTPNGAIFKRWLESGLSLRVLSDGATEERALFEDGLLERSGRSAQIREVTPSWDGRYAAITATGRGDAATQVSIIEVASGALLPDLIPDLLTTTSGSRYRVTWLPDSSGFLYPRLAPGAATGPAVARLGRGRQFLHRIGTPQSEDRPLFGYEVVPGIDLAVDDLPARTVTAPGSPWLLATLARVKEDVSELWAAPLDGVLAGRPVWSRIAGDGYTQALLRADTVYAMSAEGADRRRIVRRELGKGSPQWTVALPEQPGVLRSFVLARDALYFTELSQGLVQLRRADYDGGTAQAIAVPLEGGLRFAAQSPEAAGIWFAAESWVEPGGWFRVAPEASVATPAAIAPGIAGVALSDHRDLVASELTVAAGGVAIPVSVVHRRDLSLDGTAPLLLEAYGGYGSVQTPAYGPSLAVWARQGGVYAYAHVRGGGELGESWHRAALRESKQLSTIDALAVAEALIARGFSSAGRIALLGTSSGAQIPGLALALQPELFGALIFNVGQPDEIRGARLDPTAARNLAEMGDTSSAAGVELLRRLSPYHRVPTAVRLPAMLIKSGDDDYNFSSVTAAGKYVARLQAANTGDRPIVWMNLPGGHTDLFGDDFEVAAQAMAFLFWQTGHPGYQPTAMP